MTQNQKLWCSPETFRLSFYGIKGVSKKILVPFLLEAVAADLSVVCDLKWQIVSRLCYEFNKRQYISNSEERLDFIVKLVIYLQTYQQTFLDGKSILRLKNCWNENKNSFWSEPQLSLRFYVRNLLEIKGFNSFAIVVLISLETPSLNSRRH